MKFDRPTLVAVTAPTCSGKSYLLDKLVENNIFQRIVSTTTRDIRPGEREGVDYYFIDVAKSKEMEKNDEFFELISFNNVRYGVTHAEMQNKMNEPVAPVVILEPTGLRIYEQKCREHGWDIFKIYVHLKESDRLERLLGRAVSTIFTAIDGLHGSTSNSVYSRSFHYVATDNAKQLAETAVKEHQRRLQSILGDERRWQSMSTWDAIVPGDDVEKAISMIEQGIAWRNRKNRPPVAIGAVKLPL